MNGSDKNSRINHTVNFEMLDAEAQHSFYLASISSMHQLSESVVRTLSSSQCISTVWSVVKELVENSLDAHATSIDVKLENYGLDRIEIRDNGDGIKSSDAAYACLPHYTSKLTTTDDLSYLATYGFRGEALGALCALAEVTITTMTRDAYNGMMYKLNDAGHVIDARPSPHLKGTTVVVCNLFKSLPVRRAYYGTMKRKKQELSDISRLLLAFGVMCHDVRFLLRVDKTVTWQKNAVVDIRSALLSVVGSDVMSLMQHVVRDSSDPKISLEAFLPSGSDSKHIASRTADDWTFVFINRRPIRMNSVTKLLRNYYRRSTGCLSDRHPIVFFHLTLPPANVDVNLEPNKDRVLVQREGDILRFIENILVEIYGPLMSDDGRSMDTVSEVADMMSTEQTSNTGTRDVENSIESQLKSISCSDSSNLCCTETLKRLPLQLHSTQQSSVSATLLCRDEPASMEPWNNNSIDADELDKLLICPELSFSGYSFTEVERVTKNSNELAENVMSRSEFTHNYIGEQSHLSNAASITDSGTSVKETGGKQLPSISNESEMDGSHASCIETSAIAIVDVQQLVCRSENYTESNSARKNIESNQPRIDESFSGCFRKPLRDKQQLQQQTASGSLDGVEMLLGDSNRKSKDVKTAKKRKSDAGVVRTCIDRLLLTQSGQCSLGTQRSQLSSNDSALFNARHSVSLAFSMENIRDRHRSKHLTTGISSDSSIAANIDKLIMIGQLKSHGVWFCTFLDEIFVFNSFRAREQMIYERLMQCHKLATEDLSSPVLLDHELSSRELLSVLRIINWSLPNPTNPRCCYCTDDRLLSNGFKLQQFDDPATGNSRVELIALTKVVNYYGLPELYELLVAIRRDNSCTVANTRPSTVKHYLQGEAVRMARQCPRAESLEDAKEILEDAIKSLIDIRSNCFHDLPILHSIYSTLNSSSPVQAGIA